MLIAAMTTVLFPSQAFAKPGDPLRPGIEAVLVREQIYSSEDTAFSSFIPDTNLWKVKRHNLSLFSLNPLTGSGNVSMALLSF